MRKNNLRGRPQFGFILRQILPFALLTVLSTNFVYAQAPVQANPAKDTKKAGPANPSDPALAPPPGAPSASNSAPGADDASNGPGLFSGFLDPFDYDPRGRRDPFGQPVADVPMTPGSIHGPLLPLQTFEVNQLRVVGILWNVRNPKAMIKDPNGKLHVVGTNTKVGPRNGYIAVIREGELVVVETIEQDGRLVSSAQVVKIAK